ncbi:hypothetical protein [Acidithiobacillus ferrivorans]|nr:hypothetical protein [Acidithiobacillus ferrivorans]
MSDEKETENKEPFYKSKFYFDLKDAAGEVSTAFGVKKVPMH